MPEFAYLKSQVFNNPLLIHPAKLAAIWGSLAPRVIGAATDQADAEAQQDGPDSAAAESMDRLPSYHRYQITPEGVAVIPILGTLVNRGASMNAYSGLTGYANIEARLNHALENRQVEGILLAIDSPGGAAAGCFDLARQIREACKIKPVWAVADAVAYSAAYALACATKKVYVAQEGGAGSIGVIAWHLDHSAWDEKEGLKWTPVWAGARKKDFNPHEPLSDTARARLQADINDLYQTFTDLVAQYRRLEVKAVVDTEAATYLGPRAVKAGLADKVGNARTALADLTNLISKNHGGIVRLAAAADGNNQQMEGETLPGTNQAAATAQEPNAQGEQMDKEQIAAEARTNERKRIDSIMGCEEAKGREKLAKHLALKTDTSPDAAREILAEAAEENQPAPESGDGGFFAQMIRESEGVEPNANAAEAAEGGPSLADLMRRDLKRQGLTPRGE